MCFWNLHDILNILKTDEPHSFSICEIIGPKRRSYLNAKKVLFDNTFFLVTLFRVGFFIRSLPYGS